MKKVLFFISTLFFGLFSAQGQTIISQDFEGPLSGGWFSTGTLAASQSGINSYAGAGMLALAVQKKLDTPVFTLPSGSKNLNFWLNVAGASALANITATLKQNGTTVFNLGSWTYLSDWQQVNVSIPSGYSGTNFSITFSVQGNATTIYTLDEIYLDAGSVSTSLQESQTLTSEISVGKNIGNQNKLNILSKKDSNKIDIEVYNLSGQLIFSDKMVVLQSDKAFEIDLTDFNTGLYLLVLRQDDKVLKEKIIR